MGVEVSTLLESIRSNLETDYSRVDWRVATLTTNIQDERADAIGTLAVDDREEIEAGAYDLMTGDWYVNLPLVITLYFSRFIFRDYGVPRDFAFTIGAWFRRRLAGTPAQAVSQTATLIRQVEMEQKIIDGVDDNRLGHWLVWQVGVVVPLGITPQFPALPANQRFALRQGPPAEPDIRIDEIYYSDNPAETDPAQAEQLYP